MTQTSPITRQIDLAAECESASYARAFVRDTLAEWGYSAVEGDVSLAVSELVTNAVVHAHSPACLTLLDLDGTVQVRVRDDEPNPPQVQTPSTTDVGGRGMMLIDAVSANWGVEADPPGKIVWLDITDH